jgi:CBS domain-containing protein
MQTINDILTRKGRQVWTIDPDAGVYDAIAQMAAKDVGALVVVEGARLVGIVSEREYTRRVALAGRSPRDTRVRDIMRTTIPPITPETRIEACMALMTEHRLRHLPVMADAEVIGLVSIGDLVAAIIGNQQRLIAHLSESMAAD